MSKDFIIFASIVAATGIAWQIYYEKILIKRILLKRKKKIFEKLNNEFEELKENNQGFLEYNTDGKTILFECNPIYIGRTIYNDLKIHLDITNIEEDIKKLCKIHFDCSKINERDYVTTPIRLYFMTLSRIGKEATKVVHETISETEFYISQKRAERDKKITAS